MASDISPYTNEDRSLKKAASLKLYFLPLFVDSPRAKRFRRNKLGSNKTTRQKQPICGSSGRQSAHLTVV